MKFKIVFFAFILLSIQAFSQSKNNISILYGVAGNDVNIHGSIGDFGYNGKSGTMFGLSYTRDLNHSLSLETGLVFSDNKTQETYIIPGIGEGISNGTVKMITIPVFVKYTFFKYLYLDGGPLIDKQTNYHDGTSLNDQSGIGLEFGIGGKYTTGPVTFFINPSIREHSIINFSNDGSNFNLREAGVKFGVGYGF